MHTHSAKTLRNLVSLKDVSKIFSLGRKLNLHAVDNVTIDIREGETLGLVGESGSGKTTLGRVIIKLYTENSGQLVFDGKDISGNMPGSVRKAFSRQVQMIFQDPYSSLNPRMTVRDIIAEGPDAHGMWQGMQNGKSVRDVKVAEWLVRVGLHASHANRYPHEFSGGQRQRIGIARALAVEPKLVICDEPISALDVSVQAQIIHLLRDLQRERGLTYLFIAHDLSMVRVLCNRMAVMYLGKLVELGPADVVYDKPQHPYTQALISANPIPDPVAERERKRLPIKGEIGTPVNPKPGCRFAPRCPYAMQKCLEVTPNFYDAREASGSSEEHVAACHLLSH